MKTAIPSIYPAEGVFEFSPIHFDLSCATPGARVPYTPDGFLPTMDRSVYQRELGLIPLRCRLENEKTFAEADGLGPRPVEDFHYRLMCCPKGTYRHGPATVTAQNRSFWCKVFVKNVS